ncbi:undecaprenyl-phosphate galactose phosphotransferase WbaP [uncultured Treponema sp.]|uniref:undecaprenyl-phosphate galactose phosphotransferase WbaP n=1 Tax=uncultured Treponema sp. TaxID=162155 RepID=UPI0025D0C1C7|nr:undecaprenyl-phosphate galactose phosphotransferase WbaP [uncultured Treponema sp.]
MTNEEYKKFFKKNFWRTSSFTSGTAFMIVDAIVVMLCIGISFFIINFINHSWINFRSFITYWVYLPPMMAVFYAAGLYPGLVYPPADEVKKFGICSFFVFVGIALSITVEEADDKLPIIVALILATPFALILLPASRELARTIFSKQKWFGVPAVIYVSGNSGDVIIKRLMNRPDLGYKPGMIVDSKALFPTEKFGIPLYPPSEESFSLVKSFGIKVAILCDYDRDTTYINSYYRYTIQVPRINDISTISTNVRDFGGILGFSSTHNLTKRLSLFWKRFIDIFLLLISCPLTLPVTFVVALLIKITSPGPVFYGHKRSGKNGKEFKCWKFRSMVIDADKQLEKILAENPEMRREWEKDRKFTNDPRVTKIGKILRKTSIDELPQFFNVLTGEMSFVGPRPVTEPELVKYGNKAKFILSVKPGLSGMWQISGRSDTGYEERVTLDSYYIQNWSVWLDIWIIIKTIYVVLRGKGAY